MQTVPPRIFSDASKFALSFCERLAVAIFPLWGVFRGRLPCVNFFTPWVLWRHYAARADSQSFSSQMNIEHFQKLVDQWHSSLRPSLWLFVLKPSGWENSTPCRCNIALPELNALWEFVCDIWFLTTSQQPLNGFAAPVELKILIPLTAPTEWCVFCFQARRGGETVAVQSFGFSLFALHYEVHWVCIFFPCSLFQVSGAQMCLVYYYIYYLLWYVPPPAFRTYSTLCPGFSFLSWK